MKGVQLTKEINGVIENVSPFTESGMIVDFDSALNSKGFAAESFVTESLEEAEQRAIREAEQYTDEYFNPTEVFDGSVYLISSQSYTWDASLMKNGLIVICTRYTPGEGMLGYGYGVYIIPKAAIEALPGRSFWKSMDGDTNGAKKTMYITPTSIHGADDNGVAPNNAFVFCKIIVY